jgi:hypothetical protein
VIRFVGAALLFCVWAPSSFALPNPNQPPPSGAQSQAPVIVSSSGKHLESIFDEATASSQSFVPTATEKQCTPAKAGVSRDSGFDGCSGHYLTPVFRRCSSTQGCNYLFFQSDPEADYEDGEMYGGPSSCGCPVWEGCFSD